AAARRQGHPGASRRRGAGRHDRRAGDRRDAEAALTLPVTSPAFKDNARAALADVQLQRALSRGLGFTERRKAAADALPEFDALRDAARDIKDHTLAHLDLYLEAYEQRVIAAGGKVHYALDAESARNVVLDICRSVGAKSVTKGKTMIAEEIGLNDF